MLSPNIFLAIHNFILGRVQYISHYTGKMTHGLVEVTKVLNDLKLSKNGHDKIFLSEREAELEGIQSDLNHVKNELKNESPLKGSEDDFRYCCAGCAFSGLWFLIITAWDQVFGKNMTENLFPSLVVYLALFLIINFFSNRGDGIYNGSTLNEDSTFTRGYIDQFILSTLFVFVIPCALSIFIGSSENEPSPQTNIAVILVILPLIPFIFRLAAVYFYIHFGEKKSVYTKQFQDLKNRYEKFVDNDPFVPPESEIVIL